MFSRGLQSPDRSFTGDEVVNLRQPMVYVWRRGDEILYVGLGTKGIQRPLASDHHILLDILPSDRLDIFFCPTDVQAAKLEEEWIRHLKPEKNRANTGTGLSGCGMKPATIAKKLNIDVESVIAACESGELKATPVGESWRIRSEAATIWSKNSIAVEKTRPYLSVSKAAKQYNIDENDLRAWIRKGALPHYRVGPKPGLIRLCRDDLEAVLPSP
jgi:excisionase family DNA binding protein